MIYALYLNGIQQTYANWGQEAPIQLGSTDSFTMMGEYIRRHPEHKFVVITTVDQDATLKDFIEKGKLQDCIAYRWERGVTNKNYPDRPRRLHLHIFQGKA